MMEVFSHSGPPAGSAQPADFKGMATMLNDTIADDALRVQLHQVLSHFATIEKLVMEQQAADAEERGGDWTYVTPINGNVGARVTALYNAVFGE